MFLFIGNAIGFEGAGGFGGEGGDQFWDESANEFEVIFVGENADAFFVGIEPDGGLRNHGFDHGEPGVGGFPFERERAERFVGGGGGDPHGVHGFADPLHIGFGGGDEDLGGAFFSGDGGLGGEGADLRGEAHCIIGADGESSRDLGRRGGLFADHLGESGFDGGLRGGDHVGIKDACFAVDGNLFAWDEGLDGLEGRIGIEVADRVGSEDRLWGRWWIGFGLWGFGFGNGRDQNVDRLHLAGVFDDQQLAALGERDGSTILAEVRGDFFDDVVDGAGAEREKDADEFKFPTGGEIFEGDTGDEFDGDSIGEFEDDEHLFASNEGEAAGEEDAIEEIDGFGGGVFAVIGVGEGTGRGPIHDEGEGFLAGEPIEDGIPFHIAELEFEFAWAVVIPELFLFFVENGEEFRGIFLELGLALGGVGEGVELGAFKEELLEGGALGIGETDPLGDFGVGQALEWILLSEGDVRE